jgi:hypothetical protein
MLNSVVSGNQIGVNRTGLDAALEAEISVGSWCPIGRLADRDRTERTTVNPYRFSEYE